MILFIIYENFSNLSVLLYLFHLRIGGKFLLLSLNCSIFYAKLILSIKIMWNCKLILILHPFLKTSERWLLFFAGNILESNFTENDLTHSEALKYIAGSVAGKYRIKYPYLGCRTEYLGTPFDKSHWIRTISDGYLTEPSDDFMQVAKEMDKELNKFHGNHGLSKECFIFKKLGKRVNNIISHLRVKIPEEVLMTLIRTRTYIRLNYWQEQIQEEEKKKKAGNKQRKEMNKLKKAQNQYSKETKKLKISKDCSTNKQDNDEKHRRKEILKFLTWLIPHRVLSILPRDQLEIN